MNTGDVLAGALNHFRQNGWTRSALERADGSCCARGAINTVMTGNAFHFAPQPEEKTVLTALYRHIPSDWLEENNYLIQRRVAQDMHRSAYHPTVDHYCDEDYWTVVHAVIDYNNSRKDFADIDEWFSKAAADEGVSV